MNTHIEKDFQQDGTIYKLTVKSPAVAINISHSSNAEMIERDVIIDQIQDDYKEYEKCNISVDRNPICFIVLYGYILRIY